MASFLEAVVGRPAQNPSPGERARALELLARLIENAAGVPLKLGPSLGEQPDFVASQEALRYIYALRGDRNFKTGPSTAGNDKVSPLALHCWQAIQKEGPLDVAALQPILGRDITEAAIARGLQELWARLYIFPILNATGQPARWELTSRRFPQQVASGASTGHAEAHSAMVSLYLHSAVAATEDEIVAFLSPVTTQSKLREVIRGLGSMRQLDIIDIDGRSHVCLQGGLLPEMVAQLSEEQLGASLAPEASAIADRGPEIQIEAAPQELYRPWRPRPQGETSEHRQGPDGPKRFAPKKFVSRKFPKKKFAAGNTTGEGAGPKRFEFRASGDRVRGSSGGYGRGQSEERSSRPGFGGSRMDASGKPATRGLGERARRWEKSGETAGGASSEGKSFSPRSGFKPSVSNSSGFNPAGSRPRASKGAAHEDRPSKPWSQRGAGDAGASGFSTRDRRERTRDDGKARPKRWENKGTATDRRISGSKPQGSKSSGFKSGGFKSSGYKPAGSKPWAASRAANGEGTSDYRARGRGEGPTGERPGRWGKPVGSDRAKPAGRKPSGYTASGFKSAGTKSGDARIAGPKSFGGKPAGAKTWASKGPASGASSRVGSARSYAARTAEGAESRERAKPYGKSGSVKAGFSKPGFSKGSGKRASSDANTTGDRPKLRERTGSASGDQGGAKPFWAKNPRGGKGSTAGSRTNRPKGKKKSGKDR